MRPPGTFEHCRLIFLRNTIAPLKNEEEDGWVFDTVKPGTVSIPKDTRRQTVEILKFPSEDVEDASEMLDKMALSDMPSTRPIANSTVRRAIPPPEQSPSIRRSNTKRRSSGIKQPLGLNMSYGNSPSTVRQFRRVSDRQPEAQSDSCGFPPGMDENGAPTNLFSEPTTKEGILGRKAYSKGVGIACQEILSTTWDGEKREAIARLAEAWSDLEMVDPEGLFHIVKLSYDKLQA